jgi:hypothetical protein
LAGKFKAETILKKILPLSITTGVLALIIGFMPLAQAQVTSDTVKGEVTILAGGTCGLVVTAGDPIAFGSLTPSAESGPKTVTVSNPGTAATNIYVSGANWKSDAAAGGDVMLVGATHYGTPVQPSYLDKPALTATATDTGISVLPGAGLTKNIDFQLKANLIVSGFTGPSSQDVFIGSLC